MPRPPYPKGHYNPNVEVRVKKTAKQKRAVILTIFLPAGESSNLYDELEAALKKPSRRNHGVALSRLANQAPFANLTPEQDQRVLELIAEIKSIFESVKKAS